MYFQNFSSLVDLDLKIEENWDDEIWAQQLLLETSHYYNV